METIVPFLRPVVAGGKTNDALLPSCRDAKLVEKKVFKATATKDELAAWMDKF